ncbi:hypothetical protein WA158_006916 [Blastocystis sp. Blastoise]
MDGFPKQFMPSQNHQTITENQIPIPITTNQSLKSSPYTFDFHYNTVDNPYIDFSNSYLELWLNVKKTKDSTSASLIQHSNIYALIDKVTVDMVYISPTGTDIAVNYSEPSLNSSKARKFIAIKELSKFELDKSIYATVENLYDNVSSLKTLAYMIDNSKSDTVTTFKILIPLMLITGLGTFDCAIKLKTMKFQFVTNYLTKLASQTDCFSEFNLDKAFMNFRHMYDINWGNDARNLIKCIPNNCQISYFVDDLGEETVKASAGNAVMLKSEFTTSKNRSVNFVPDYCLMFLTYAKDAMVPTNLEAPTTINFQIGGKNMFTQTQFPTATRRIPGTSTSLQTIPNNMLYNIWRSQSNPMCVLDGDKWYEQPIYLFPIGSVVDVNTRSGCEINYYIQTSPCGTGYKFGASETTDHKVELFIHFIFVKFVRDGAMN